MCIRDRASVVIITFSDTPLAEKILFHVQALRPEVPVIVRTCLLYTSDAADERSSVDLGGRRIIKKKKTNRRPGTEKDRETEQVINMKKRTNRK